MKPNGFGKKVMIPFYPIQEDLLAEETGIAGFLRNHDYVHFTFSKMECSLEYVKELCWET